MDKNIISHRGIERNRLIQSQGEKRKFCLTRLTNRRALPFHRCLSLTIVLCLVTRLQLLAAASSQVGVTVSIRGLKENDKEKKEKEKEKKKKKNQDTPAPTLSPTTVAPTAAPTVKANFRTQSISEEQSDEGTTKPTAAPMTTESEYVFPAFRYVPYSNLTKVVEAEALGYTEDTWNSPGTAAIEAIAFLDLNADQVEAATSLGFTEVSWDCNQNHYAGYTWSELTEYGLVAYYEALGFGQASWEGLTDAPAVNDLFWAELDEAQQDAAEELCFFRETWDMVHIDQWLWAGKIENQSVSVFRNNTWKPSIDDLPDSAIVFNDTTVLDRFRWLGAILLLATILFYIIIIQLAKDHQGEKELLTENEHDRVDMVGVRVRTLAMDEANNGEKSVGLSSDKKQKQLAPSPTGLKA